MIGDILSDAGSFVLVAFGFSLPLFFALAALFASVRSRAIEAVGIRTLLFMGYIAPINLIFRLFSDIAHLKGWPGAEVLFSPAGVAIVIGLDVFAWMLFMIRDERPVKAE